MKIWNGSSLKGLPRSGVPSGASPFRWTNMPSMIDTAASASVVLNSRSFLFRSFRNRLQAFMMSSPAMIFPETTSSAYLIAVSL